MEHQPNIAEGEFVDSDGHLRKVVDKCVIMTTEYLWSDSSYPRNGLFPCEVLSTWTDDQGQSLAEIDIYVQTKSEDRLERLVVSASIISDYFS